MTQHCIHSHEILLVDVVSHHGLVLQAAVVAAVDDKQRGVRDGDEADLLLKNRCVVDRVRCEPCLLRIRAINVDDEIEAAIRKYNESII